MPLAGSLPNTRGQGRRVAIVLSRFNPRSATDCSRARCARSQRRASPTTTSASPRCRARSNRRSRCSASRRPANTSALVALGAVIRGETYHFEIVSNESAAGISSVQLEFGIPIGNGILTCDTDAQALARMDQKGYEAAQAALEMANLLDDIDEQ